MGKVKFEPTHDMNYVTMNLEFLYHFARTIVINMIQAYFSLPEKDNTVETTKPFPLFPSPRQVAEE